MKSGTRPTRIDHRDYDLIKSHRLYGATTEDAQFADEYFADAGLIMDNQEVTDTEFQPPTPPMPEGCTDFSTAGITTNLTKQIHNPNDIEAVTHANAQGGYDIRSSLLAGRGIGWFRQFFNIKTNGVLDWFDTFRLAQLSGVCAGEIRSISWGTPWFPTWEQAANSGSYVMPMPTHDELSNFKSMPWHNSILDGWHTFNGVLVYRNESHQGNLIGDRGFIAFPREVINTVMSLPGTVAFTPSNTPILNPVTITVSNLQWILSVMQNIISDLLK